MDGKYGMPIIKKCDVDVSSIRLIGSDKIKSKDMSINIKKTVHFFIEDNKIDRFYKQPHVYLKSLAQYPHVLTPDYSLYADMPISLQIYNTFRSRWCGAYWQEYGLSVIPSVSWSTAESYDFCFDGLESGTVVSISTLGGLLEKNLFLKGYFEMVKRITPKQILCFGKSARALKAFYRGTGRKA
jgi:hypothetical protein